MSGFEFVLLLVGAALVTISFMIGEKLTETKVENAEFHIDSTEVKEQTDIFKKEIDDYLEKAKETTIDSINDSLCHLSNEKIMNVNEYGDMVLERIDKNHSEVVFLYGMLNDKEKEIKEMLTKPNQKEIELEESMKKVEQPIRVVKAQGDVPMASKEIKVEEAEVDQGDEVDHEAFNARQEQIIALHKKGKSILEISKQLDIGQGEVQLVVHLYTGGLS